MQIFMYNSDDFDSLNAAIQEKRVIAAMSVFFQVSVRWFNTVFMSFVTAKC